MVLDGNKATYGGHREFEPEIQQNGVISPEGLFEFYCPFEPKTQSGTHEDAGRFPT